MNKAVGMMQPWRAVRANCSFAKLVLQAPYSTARTHAPTESYAMSFVYLPIYTPAIPVKPSCKDNGSFSAAACCFLSFLCNLSRPNYSSISCRSTIFHRVLSPFYLLIKPCVHIMYSVFLLPCRFTLCTWATTMASVLL
jgi:hypothetical protein